MKGSCSRSFSTFSRICWNLYGRSNSKLSSAMLKILWKMKLSKRVRGVFLWHDKPRKRKHNSLQKVYAKNWDSLPSIKLSKSSRHEYISIWKLGMIVIRQNLSWIDSVLVFLETRLKEVIPSHFKASKFNFFQPWWRYFEKLKCKTVVFSHFRTSKFKIFLSHGKDILKV